MEQGMEALMGSVGDESTRLDRYEKEKILKLPGNVPQPENPLL
ncbi:hypothetical protein [Bacillus sp. Marseille-Q1617]|nr:hypothetical protein [Bacillus sp. Marseille-Q1617]